MMIRAALVVCVSLAVTTPARADLPVEVHAASGMAAPGVTDACFIGGRSYPPQVNNADEVAFILGLTCSGCPCEHVTRAGSTWFVNPAGAYPVTATETIQCAPPCPLTDKEGPGKIHTYDDGVLSMDQWGNIVVLSRDAEDGPWGLYVFWADCVADSWCPSGVCDASGVCTCNGDHQCVSGRCVGGFCQRDVDNAVWNGETLGNRGDFVFGFPYSVRISPVGEVVFKAGISGGAGPALEGLFRTRPGFSSSVVALDENPAPGVAGQTFASFGAFEVTPKGTVVFQATATGSNKGIWAEALGGSPSLQVLADGSQGTPDSGQFVDIDKRFVGMGDFGILVFAATYQRLASDPPTPLKRSGVFLALNWFGPIQHVSAAQRLTGDNHVALQALKPIPGGAAYLETIRENDEVIPRLAVSGVEIVRAGDAAPMEGGETPQLYFHDFNSLTANRSGQVAFVGALRPACAPLAEIPCRETAGCTWTSSCEVIGDPKVGPMAIFVWDADSGLQRVLRTQAELEVAPGDSRTVTDIFMKKPPNLRNQPLETTPLNDWGKLCFMVEFEDDSDNLGVTCTRSASPPNTPPVVEILTPFDGQIFWEDQPIAFEAKVTDAEDAAIPAGDIVWSSNIEGQLLTGPDGSSLASALTPGTHVIAVKATDSGGKWGSDSIAIVVEQAQPAVASDVAVELSADSARLEVAEVLELQMLVTNQGPQAATAVTAQLPLPKSFTPGTLVTDTGTCEQVDGAVQCELGQLDLAAEARVTVTAMPQDSGRFDLLARAGSSVLDPLPHNNRSSAAVQVHVAPTAGDGGTATPDGGVAGDGGPSAADAGSGPGPDDGDGGCGGCQTWSGPGGDAPWWLIAWAAMLFRRRGRRRRGSR